MPTVSHAAAHTARLTPKDQEDRMSKLVEDGAQHPNRGRMPHPALDNLHAPPHGLPLRARIRSASLLVPDLADLLRPATCEFPAWGSGDADGDARVVGREAGSVDSAVEDERSGFPKRFRVEGHPPKLDVRAQCAVEEIIVQDARHGFQIAHPLRGEPRASFLDPIFPAG